MLTLFHAPMSRSTSVLALLREMGIEDRVEVREVTIRRHEGHGATDPNNPHPEGKVPCLQDGTDIVYERGAIFLYLTDRFPEAGWGRPVGDPERGRFLSWLFHYQGVIEPLIILKWSDVKHQMVDYQLRTLDDVVRGIDLALQDGPWLLGNRISAIDPLIAGLFGFAQFDPQNARVQDWIDRNAAREAVKSAYAEDKARFEALQA